MLFSSFNHYRNYPEQINIMLNKNLITLIFLALSSNSAISANDELIEKCASLSGSYFGATYGGAKPDLSNANYKAAYNADKILSGSGSILLSINCIQGKSIEGDLGAKSIASSCKSRSLSANDCLEELFAANRRLVK